MFNQARTYLQMLQSVSVHVYSWSCILNYPDIRCVFVSLAYLFGVVQSYLICMIVKMFVVPANALLLSFPPKTSI